MSQELPSRVLVVDDDADITEFLSTCFQKAGHQVWTAASGDEALQIAAEVHPHVVFLDILIPEQDGWLVCSKLKLPPGSPAIVLMTGQKGASTRRFAEFVHADSYLEKPFSVDDALQQCQLSLA